MHILYIIIHSIYIHSVFISLHYLYCLQLTETLGLYIDILFMLLVIGAFYILYIYIYIF